MNNRLTASTLVCPGWSLQQIVERYASLGLNGIDFRGVQQALDHSTLAPFTTGAADTLKMLADHGLSVPCMCSSVVLMAAGDDRWNQCVEEFKRYLELADRFGSPFIRVFPGRTPAEMDRDAAAAMARRRACQLADLAEPYSAVPILETHDDWGASSEVVRLVADCEPGDFPVIWDVRHTWAAKEAPDDVIRTLGPRLQHVHVKDSVIVNGKETPSLLGAGVVDVGDALAGLKRADYTGWVCLETEKRWHPNGSPEPEQSLPQFVEFVRGI
jgi:sugar phosphate isomerase/epimerase